MVTTRLLHVHVSGSDIPGIFIIEMLVYVQAMLTVLSLFMYFISHYT